MDPDAELKKQIDLAKQNLLMLSAMEIETSQRVRNPEVLAFDHEKRSAQHMKWVADREAASRYLERSMGEMDCKLKALVAAVNDLNYGKRPPLSL